MRLELRDPANIGGRIQHIRERREMSMSDLARAIGIKQPSMTDIESGKSKSPSAACRAIPPSSASRLIGGFVVSRPASLRTFFNPQQKSSFL